MKRLLILLSVLFVALPASGQLNQATVSGEFSNNAIWNSGAAPTTTDGVNESVIQAATTVTLSGGSAGVFGTIDVGRNGANGTTGILQVTGGTLVAAGNVSVGNNDIGQGGSRTGILDLQSGVVEFHNRNTLLGTAIDNTGILVQSGGTLSFDGSLLNIGQNGTGLATFTGGVTNLNTNLAVAQLSTARGAVTFAGTANVTTSASMLVGVRAGAVGTMVIAEDAAVTATQLLVGQGSGDVNQNDAGAPGPSTGMLTMTGGDVTLTSTFGSLIVGNNDDTAGTFVMTGGNLVTNGDIVFANDGAMVQHVNPANPTQTRFAAAFGAPEGTFEITGGTVRVGNLTGGGDDFVVGNRGFGAGTIAGDARVYIDRRITIGNLREDVGLNSLVGIGTGNGSLTIGGDAVVDVGGEVDAGVILIGFEDSTSGTLNIEDNATFFAQRLFVATGVQNNHDGTGSEQRTTGVMNVSGGYSLLYDSDASILVGNWDDTAGTYTQTGGLVQTRGDFVTAGAGSFDFNVAGTNTRFASVFGAAEGTLSITGGTLEVGNGINDNLVLSNRGHTNAVFGGDAVITISHQLQQGALDDANAADADGAGRGNGILTITNDARLHIGNNWFVGLAGDGTANITAGSGSPAIQVDGRLLVGANSGSQGTFTMDGGTLTIGDGGISAEGGDDLIVGNNGQGTAVIAGNAVINIQNDLVSGNSDFMTRGNGDLTIRDDARVNVGGNWYVGRSGDGTALVTGAASPQVSVDGAVFIALSGSSTGELTIAGGTVHAKNRVQIGAAGNQAATLIQTGGVLLVDDQLITQFVEDGGGTASGYAFSGGTLSRSTPGTLVVTGDLVITDEATLRPSGGILERATSATWAGLGPLPVFAGFPGTDDGTGVKINISEGFRAVDVTATGDFMGAGILDFGDWIGLPSVTGSFEVGILWWATVASFTGADGGDNLTLGTFLDEIEISNLANLNGAQRLTELDYENNMGVGKTFDPTSQSYYALINGDGVFGFGPPETGVNLGLAFTVKTVPEPSRALLLTFALTATLTRRHRTRPSCLPRRSPKREGGTPMIR